MFTSDSKIPEVAGSGWISVLTPPAAWQVEVEALSEEGCGDTNIDQERNISGSNPIKLIQYVIIFSSRHAILVIKKNNYKKIFEMSIINQTY